MSIHGRIEGRLNSTEQFLCTYDKTSPRACRMQTLNLQYLIERHKFNEESQNERRCHCKEDTMKTGHALNLLWWLRETELINVGCQSTSFSIQILISMIKYTLAIRQIMKTNFPHQRKPTHAINSVQPLLSKHLPDNSWQSWRSSLRVEIKIQRYQMCMRRESRRIFNNLDTSKQIHNGTKITYVSGVSTNVSITLLSKSAEYRTAGRRFTTFFTFRC